MPIRARMLEPAWASEAAAASLSPAEQGPAWDLGDLYRAADDPRIPADLAAIESDAAALEDEFKGRLPECDGDRLAGLLERYEAIEDRIGRVFSFAQLLFAAHRDDPKVGQFYQGVQERVTAIGTRLLFVTLELNKLDDEVLASRVAASAGLARFRPWLDSVRSFRPHQLSDEVERTLHEKHVTGRSAWVRLFDETMAALRFPLDGKELTSAEIFDLMSSKDRAVREHAAGAISGVLEQNVRLFSRVMNTLVKDKQIEDEWRKFERPISSRNLANQVEDEVVDALIEAARGFYPRISHRYYALKARWLGLERLEFWDRNAPLPEDVDTRRPWADAKVVVLDAYRSFSPTLAEIVDRFFQGSWIDAQLRPGKDSGAFCHPTVPSVHPYVLMNYQGRNRDVMTLAHELGHGVHQVLAAHQGPLMASTPLTLAETASVFGEQLTFQALLAQEHDPVRRRVLLAAKIEDKINTVVRQIAFCDFERRVHDARRHAELMPDDLCKIWMQVQTESLGPAFHFREDYRFYWSYIPHFIHVPFYVYAYAFGDCLVSSLYAVYEEAPAGFEPRYLELLRAGGTLRHKELLAPFGLDAGDPGFWAKGLGLLEGLIDQLEATMPEPS
jgi:oligoendopeptidase F